MSGCFLLALSLLTWIAWGCGEPDYLQISATFAPLHYNGAIGFLVWGVAFLALATNRNRTACALAIALGLLGLLIIVVNVAGLGIRLDRWAFAPSGRVTPPAGVAPGLGVGFCWAAIAIAIAAARTTAAPTLLVTLLGAILVIGAPVTLLTSQSNMQLTAFGGPSLLAGVGTIIAGLALATCVFRSGVPVFAPRRAIPVAAGVVGIGVTFTLWAALNADQSRRIHRQVQFEAAHVQRQAQDRLGQEVSRFTQLAEKTADTKPAQVKLDVGSYVGQMPGCQGVCRLDAGRNITWIESQPGQPRTLEEFGVADPLADAVRRGEVAVIRPPRSSWRGARVLLIFAPHRAGTAHGGLITVLRLQTLFETFVNTNVAAGYGVTISEGPDPLFSRYISEGDHQERWAQALPLVFRGIEWRLSVWPTQDVLSRESLSLPKLALLIGLLMTALLALAVHLAQTARLRTAALEKEVRERKQAESAMRQSEEKYRTLIENLGQGIFLQDRDHRFVAANAQFCRNVGRTETEIVGATETDLYDAQRAASHAEEVRTVLAEGKTVESEQEEVVAGHRMCLRRVLTPVRDAAGETTGVLGICWDVTEQRRLETHVHQASKMDAIGQLAGGIAHDFNNLLTVILGNLELLLMQYPAGSGGHELIASAHGAAGRAAGLTQRLLGFSRRHQLDWRPTNMNNLATEVVAFLHRTIDPLVRLETRLTPELWSVQADPTQLHQVLMNLCLNARDAITGAGQITIETSCVGAEEIRGVKGPNARTGEFVRLRVSDTGAGMTPEVKARIYEPFFTTKDVGRGTGLGLAMVFAIVRQHKGWIDCWSEVGVGTRFDIYLPRSVAVRPALPDQAKATPSTAGQGTILVVDDEEMIRKLAVLTLQSRGYRVLQAADGQQAVNVYSAEKDRIDLVMLDLTMPVLSGHEAFRHLLNLNPRVRVLFASGYAVEQLSELEKQMMAGFVKKPYRPNDLLLAVEEALRGSPTTPTPPTLSTADTGRLTTRCLTSDSRI